MPRTPEQNRIVKDILGMIATILSSDFTIIDYDNEELNGKKIEIIPDIIIEEFLMYVLLCRSVWYGTKREIFWNRMEM